MRSKVDLAIGFGKRLKNRVPGCKTKSIFSNRRMRDPHVRWCGRGWTGFSRPPLSRFSTRLLRRCAPRNDFDVALDIWLEVEEYLLRTWYHSSQNLQTALNGLFIEIPMRPAIRSEDGFIENFFRCDNNATPAVGDYADTLPGDENVWCSGHGVEG